MSEDLIRKIRGLLATAESLSEQGNQEAADSYIAKAHELQQKYSIDQAMLAAQGKKAEAVVITRTFNLPGAWGRRKVTLAHQVGLVMDTMGYFSHRYPIVTKQRADGTTYEGYNYSAKKIYTWTAFGFAEDVEWLETLVTSLCHQSDDALRQAQANRGWDHHKTFGAQFMEGFTSTVRYRLIAARKEAQQAAQSAQDAVRAQDAADGVESAQETHSVALVLASKKERVEKEYKAKMGKGGRKSSTRSGYSSSGYSAGSAAGSRATIARGSVGGSSKGTLGR